MSTDSTQVSEDKTIDVTEANIELSSQRPAAGDEPDEGHDEATETVGKESGVEADPADVPIEDPAPSEQAVDPYSIPVRGHSNTGPRRRKFVTKVRSGCITCK